MEIEGVGSPSGIETAERKSSTVIGQSVPENYAVAAEKSEKTRNLTPPVILETACSPENQRHRRKFPSLISQEQQQQQQLFVRHSSGSIRTPSLLTVQKRPSSSAVYSHRASSSGPLFPHPMAASPAISTTVSPLYPTSDLGSSPRSSLSATTTAGPSSAASSITDGGSGRFSFSREMTPQDVSSATIFSPGMLYSPTTSFSPFMASPNEDAVFQSPTVFRFEAQKMIQRPYFSFDPKSPSFLLHTASTSYESRYSDAALQEPNSALSLVSDQKAREILSATLIGDRERSRSDSDVVNLGGQQPKDTGAPIHHRSNVPSLYSLTPSAAVQKKIFKKQILERYQTEIVPNATSDEFGSAVNSNLSSSCSPLLAQLSFFPHFPSTTTAFAGDSIKSTQESNLLDVLLPPHTVEIEKQTDKIAQVKPVERCSILELMLKNPLFASLAFRQDSAISSSPSTLSPFWTAAVAGNTNLSSPSSSTVAMFNRAPCLTLPTTPVTAKVDRSSSIEENSINKRSRSESDMSQKSSMAFHAVTAGRTLASMIDESQAMSSLTTTKSHKCAVCQKAFGRSDMLTRHMRLHTGIKPYACRVCGQVFSRSDHLSTHQRTHTGEKPYHCPQCTYSASRRDMITRHMRTHLRQRLGASASASSVGDFASSSSASSASFESTNCGSTTRLSDCSPRIDFDLSGESKHVSVIRRINSAKDLCECEDVTGLIHIEETTTAENKISYSVDVESSCIENAQVSTDKTDDVSSIGCSMDGNSATRDADDCLSLSYANENKCPSRVVYERHYGGMDSELAEEEVGYSTAGGQSGTSEKSTTIDAPVSGSSIEHIRIKTEPE